MKEKPLWIAEEEVKRLLDMRTAIDALEAAMRLLGNGEASNAARRRHRVPGGTLQVMDAAAAPLGVMGLKAYSAMRDGTAEFYVMLFSSESGKLLAIIEAEWMGRVRTGAATAVAAKFLARENASTIGLVGSGKQAATQLEALCAVRPVKRAAVWSRDRAKLAAFCAERSVALGIPVEPAGGVEDAVRGKDLVVTATPAREPFLCGKWLEKGCHVTAMGANNIARREIMPDVFSVTDRIVADSVEQARIESGEVQAAVDAGITRWDAVLDLGGIVAGKASGRASADEITLFKSHGLALWDVAVAQKVLAASLRPGSYDRG